MPEQRWFVLSPEGSWYGPATIAELNQWISEDRIGPTTVLKPEQSAVRLAASMVEGLVWKEGQSFESEATQLGNHADHELRSAILCSVLCHVCCLGQGFQFAAAILAVILGVRCIRRAKPSGWLAIILGSIGLLWVVAQISMGLWLIQPSPNGQNYDKILEHFKPVIDKLKS
jgi:hypothetical protein